MFKNIKYLIKKTKLIIILKKYNIEKCKIKIKIKLNKNNKSNIYLSFIKISPVARN